MKHTLITSLLFGIALFAISAKAEAQTQASAKVAGNSNGAASAVQPPVLDSPNALTEGFVFYIQNFKYQHQSELNTLNITVKYTYVSGIEESDYPEFRLVLNDMKAFLESYPDEEAYWEILNKGVTEMVLRKYPVISSITSEMQVSPSPMITFLRASTVTRQRPGPRR